MKEVILVSLNSQQFKIDSDAYDYLNDYLDQIRQLLDKDESEVVDDIEARIAEIFNERLSSAYRVVDINMVRDTVREIGNPELLFGDERNPKGDRRDRRLFRSQQDYVIGGVCGGLAEYFGVSSTSIRLVTLLLILFGGISIWVYIILWIIIPNQKRKYI